MKKIIKIIAWVLIAAFIAQDAVWAKPEIFENRQSASTLQIPSFFQPLDARMDKQILEVTLKSILEYAHESLEGGEFRYHLTPTVGKVLLNLEFDKARREGNTIIVPCATSSGRSARLYEAVISSDKSIKLIRSDKINGDPSSEESSDFDELATVSAVSLQGDGEEKNHFDPILTGAKDAVTSKPRRRIMPESLRLLSGLLIKDVGYDWEAAYAKGELPDLNGPLKPTDAQGEDTFCPVEYYQFRWRILGSLESGWKPYITENGVKNKNFQFTVRLTKGGRAINRVFQIGPQARILKCYYQKNRVPIKVLDIGYVRTLNPGESNFGRAHEQVSIATTKESMPKVKTPLVLDTLLQNALKAAVEISQELQSPIVTNDEIRRKLGLSKVNYDEFKYNRLKCERNCTLEAVLAKKGIILVRSNGPSVFQRDAVRAARQISQETGSNTITNKEIQNRLNLSYTTYFENKSAVHKRGGRTLEDMLKDEGIILISSRRPHLFQKNVVAAAKGIELRESPSREGPKEREDENARPKITPTEHSEEHKEIAIPENLAGLIREIRGTWCLWKTQDLDNKPYWVLRFKTGGQGVQARALLCSNAAEGEVTTGRRLVVQSLNAKNDTYKLYLILSLFVYFQREEGRNFDQVVFGLSKREMLAMDRMADKGFIPKPTGLSKLGLTYLMKDILACEGLRKLSQYFKHEVTAEAEIPVGKSAQFLRNIVNPEELSQNMIEGILSALFSNKKLTLAFSKKLKGLESAQLKALVRQLRKWKESTAQKNKGMKALLDNFTILEYDDLKVALNEKKIDATA
ncbi:MAG: hypothetical protein Q8O01_01055, partial [Candidatus Omnitrophota bacterium]|nr:hypothetical protein [Candidatus Omnitrophota bacterium]